MSCFDGEDSVTSEHMYVRTYSGCSSLTYLAGLRRYVATDVDSEDHEQIICKCVCVLDKRCLCRPKGG